MGTANSTTTPMLQNRYVLEETIGSGGMAVVYRARDRMLERTVAIKLLRPKYSGNQAFQEQFRREARAAANLSHPNIVTIYDIGYDSGRLFIVMEYIEGQNLKDLIRQKGVFELHEALPLMIQAAKGVGYAHRARVVHCDVKPHNMLVTKDGHLKVTDFGIARAIASIHPDETADEIWGSPQYFSPEQASGQPPMPYSDVYSLGVVFYEMLTGQLPYTGKTPADLARQHRDPNIRPIPPRHLNRDIPEKLEEILLVLLSKDPRQRFRNADILARMLEGLEFAAPQNRVVSTTPRSNTTPPQASPSSASIPAEYTPPKSKPSPSEALRSSSSTLFTPDIIVLAIIALVLGVGLLPFYSYILNVLGWVK
ncbi:MULTISPECIES: protein kinase domain-containing protein [Anaerolinea]|uniref:protein kinase domain-containing protein n=1 Tax=Anaerolinea TaxID=233189 RepID=UPI00261B6706|nr:protein kinase [Anaerolinea thermophila]